MASGDVSPWVPLRLALAGAWHALRGRSLGQFPRVLRVLEAVGRAAPAALHFRHWARLRLGLQAAVVVRMLQEGQPDGRILDAIDSFFPEGDGAALAAYGHPSPQDLELVEGAQENFRQLVLELLGDSRRRAAYLEDAAGRDYGEPFLQALESLFHEFLLRLESALPPPDVTQLQEVVWGQSGPGPRPRELPILRRYLADVGHAHLALLPRPLRWSGRPLNPAPSSTSRPAKPRPGLRRLRPLHVRPLEFLGDVSSDSEAEEVPRRKARLLPLPRRAALLADADWEGDRDRHRAHRQGGAHQGARGGEGRDPPPAAAPHLQRQADERREDGGRLQDPGRLRPPSCPRPARGRGPAVRGWSPAQAPPPRHAPRGEGGSSSSWPRPL
ncbi:uncharacterized protein [Anas platyrhynchos]|uniref:uncharacterized protein isoform X1 n=1 Tax=Anas platyrhynchos TaxID=8839 RepID=UPI003AF2BDD1